MPRWSTSYCSFTSRVNAFSVIAMNGSSYGTSNTGNPSPSASSHERRGQRVVVEAGAEPEAGQVMAGQEPRELALAPVGVELDAGGQQQLAARQPGRRVRQLRDVDPADGRVRAILARRELEPHLGHEPSNGEHGISGERSAPTPR